jgi:hypothetical protein
MQCNQLAQILEGLANGKGFLVFRASRRASRHDDFHGTKELVFSHAPH